MQGSLFEGPTNAETISSISSWTDCAGRCKAKASCLFWDWRDDRHNTPNTCVLNEGFTKTVDDFYGVAGSRDCQSKMRTLHSKFNSKQVLRAGLLVKMMIHWT